MISEYEKLRLENVQKNREVLVALGLAEPLIPNAARAVSQPKRPPRSDPPPSSVVKRTSWRVCGRPATYAEGLTDRDFAAEERATEYAERRRKGSGRAAKPVERFKPKDFPRPSKRDRDDGTDTVKKARSITALTVGQPKLMGTPTTVAGTSALLPAEIATVDNPQISYYTSGPQGRCPLCQNWFTITGKGKLHKHTCYSRVVTAKPVLPACVS